MKNSYTLYLIVLFSFWAGIGAGCAPGVCPETGGEFHNVVTNDGWRINVHRYPPLSLDKTPPVIVCHGLSANHQCFEPDDERNLGKFLSENGYDTWLIDLRGVGSSDRFSYEFNFDDFVRHDLPAVINYVKKVTGTRSVQWIGHSMGGMVMYAYLATGGTDVRSVIAIGSPVDFTPQNDLIKGALFQQSLLRHISHIPIRAFSGLGNLYFGLHRDSPASMLLWNVDNMEKETLRRLVQCGGDNMSGQVLAQFADWVSNGTFRSSDLKTDYMKGLSEIRVPILFIAGLLDNLAPPSSVKAAYDRVSSQDKTFRNFSRANGDSADYGHVDLVAGKKVREEVFPEIVKWLSEH